MATFQGLSAQSISEGAMTIRVDGTPMPLREVTYMNGFTSNGMNTEFTVGKTGAYFISYALFLGHSVSNPYKVALKVNGVIKENTVISREEGAPMVPLSNHIILSLTAGCTLQLVVYSHRQYTNIMCNGANASLVLVKIS